MPVLSTHVCDIRRCILSYFISTKRALVIRETRSHLGQIILVFIHTLIEDEYQQLKWKDHKLSLVYFYGSAVNFYGTNYLLMNYGWIQTNSDLRVSQYSHGNNIIFFALIITQVWSSMMNERPPSPLQLYRRLYSKYINLL